jgi:two-component SAPR family response regulator
MREINQNLFHNFKVYRIAFCFFLIFHFTGVKAQGLMFNSNDSLLTKRTSYSVFNSDIPQFQNHLFINFDLSLWDNAHLGYIFNLTGKTNSYSLSYLYSNGVGYFYFNIDRKSNKLKIPLQAAQLKKETWIKMKVDFDLLHDKVNIYIDGILHQADQLGLENPVAGKLIFGKNQYYTEVPDMAIKNLTVGDGSKEYAFPLNEWKGDVVHTAAGEETGLVENPVWLINGSYFWKPLYTRTFNEVAGLNFDPNNQNLIIYRKDSLIYYDDEGERATTVPYKNPLPVPLLLGKSIFNARENKCYVYEAYIDSKQIPSSIAALDMQSMKWESIGKTLFPQQRHHHNIIYNKNQDSIYLFGGYGSYTYYNTFYKYNPKTDKWEKTPFTGDAITPRFFSAMGKADNDNEVFLFGGYGNESGNQIVGGRQYYDLYRINLQTHTIKKCWNIHPGEVFVPANNLVLSSDKKYFYALCYPHEVAKTEIKLYKFSVKDGSYEVVSAPIPVTSERIESDINLFLDNKTNELLCSIQEFTSPVNSTIKIYSLAFPPVTKASYLSSIQIKTSTKLISVGVIVVAVLALAGAVFLYQRRNKDSTQPIYDEPDFEIDEERVAETALPAVPKKEEPKINAVYLLGEFMAFDKKGRDITYLFSPKIKQLFILILLNSKDGSGIISKKISHILWPDKDIAKTKNIKGVTFNHLRNIIGDIDGIELTFLNDIYIFNVTEAFFCDYYFVADALKMTDPEKEKVIFDHFELIQRGAMLSDMPDTWLDDFKINYEEQLMHVLLPQLQKQYADENYKVALEISRLILNVDPFNDNALKYQLRSFRRTKGIEYSKKIYDQYAAEYKKSLGIDYPISLDKILGA